MSERCGGKPGEPHVAVSMIFERRSALKHRHNGRLGVRYCNHWFRVYRCPSCGREASHQKQPIICRGTGAGRGGKT